MSGIYIIALPNDSTSAAEVIHLLSGTFAGVKALPHTPAEAEKALNHAELVLVLTGADWAQHIAAHPDIARGIAYALGIPGLPVLNVPLDGAKLPPATALPPDFPPEVRALTYLSVVPVTLDTNKVESVANLARQMAEILEQISPDFEAVVLSPAMRKVAKRRKQNFPVNLFMLLGILACGFTTLALARSIDRPLPGANIMTQADTEANDDDPVPVLLIGFAADLSGTTAGTGEELLDGVRQALTERPTLEIDGQSYSINLLTQDSACSGSGGGRVAELFASSPDVVGVIGDQCNIGCTVALPVYEAANLVSISAGCTAPELTLNPSRSFNRVIPPITAEAITAADYLFGLVGDGVALVYDEQQHARQFAPVFEAHYAALGGTLSVFIPTETTIIDYEDIAENVIESGASAVYYIGRASNAGEIRARLGQELPFVASVLGNEEAFILSAGDTADGAVMIRLLPPAVPASFTPTAAYAYDAANILLSALAGTVSVDADGNPTVDRAALLAAVRAYNGEGVTGTLNCENGDCAVPNSDIYEVRTEANADE